MTAFDDYLAQLRRLDEARRSADEAAARSATATESLGERVRRLAEQAAAQRGAVDELARAARTAPPQRLPAPPPLSGDPVADVDAAEADLEAAAVELDEARYLAHRPPWLPRWRADERNGLVYGLYALAAIVAHLVLMRVWSGLDAGDSAGTQSPLTLALFIGLGLLVPLLAFVIGWFTIGVVTRPPIAREDTRLERHWQMGLVICVSTLLVPLYGVFS
ncbi:hypothetical protein K3N28_12585 [Glycomyces sp. TRM65418]|uniref:hypothetical protein n=1 Tax=Glycomyces sp. TRM65418 TaxID=2867006 RepID=UPI001CE58476|nr:hypothetical protein [Glycomyces sp. TRM65418]MCC3763901.1 hypothetical protein [Glycomyces sp. TRM65418]QZD53604.1 hypothetical protein K3N28_12515 [Glycomyces sp. TRM65418]